MEVVNYFSRKGSPVYAALLDYRKAFDYVNHAKMFRNLIRRKINLVFIRLMMCIYLYQRCYVKWQSSRSYSFGVTNGTRQGSVASPALWSVYCDPLIQELRNLGLGAHVGGLFMGVC